MNRKHLLRVALTVCVSAVLLGTAAWIAAPLFAPDPMEHLKRQTPVRMWLDCTGRVLRLERTFDAQWRFPVPLNRISPHAVRVMLAAEDASFYGHSGVNYASVLRAAWQNLTSFRIVSGASTISMQLAGMTLPEEKRGFRRKFLQAVLARKMEKLHSKQEILEEYLNRIPFGGKLYGIEAAAQYYFGLSAAELNLAESTLLCGLPQKPNRFRPDRNPSAARERQRIVLKLLAGSGKISQKEAERIRTGEPLRLRDFRFPAGFELLSAPDETFHALQSARSENMPYRVRTSIDVELQHRVLQLLRTRRDRLNGVRDAAAVLIDNRTGEVPVYIGTLNFSGGISGQVDAARAVRSAGSALKPFLYAEAIDGGRIVASTKLNDAPLRYGDYAPGNYDGRFYGRVSAAYALSRSLNTPAVRLVAQLGEKRMREMFARAGLTHPVFEPENENAGLSLALGTVGHSLFDITRAYSILANNGVPLRITFLRETSRPAGEKTVFLPQTCAMVSSMLRGRPLAFSAYETAWKTGTSNNNRDAWCFAYTPEYTLGVWFGNKNGERSDDLVGAVAAAPAAGEVFDLLYRDRSVPRWPDDSSLFELRELCAETGLTPGVFCRTRTRRNAIPGLPLAVCRACGREEKTALKILSPAPLNYALPPGRRSVMLKIRASWNGTEWFLNGKSIGKNLTEYEFAGDACYTLRAVSESNSSFSPSSDEVFFSVGSSSAPLSGGSPISSRISRREDSVTATMAPSR